MGLRGRLHKKEGLLEERARFMRPAKDKVHPHCYTWGLGTSCY